MVTDFYDPEQHIVYITQLLYFSINGEGNKAKFCCIALIESNLMSSSKLSSALIIFKKSVNTTIPTNNVVSCKARRAYSYLSQLYTFQ